MYEKIIEMYEKSKKYSDKNEQEKLIAKIDLLKISKKKLFSPNCTLKHALIPLNELPLFLSGNHNLPLLPIPGENNLFYLKGNKPDFLGKHNSTPSLTPTEIISQPISTTIQYK